MSPSRPAALILVENLPVPFDRRVWMEATTLQKAGYDVSVICPATKKYSERYEQIEGVHIYRHPLPPEGDTPASLLREYAAALWHEWRLTGKVRRERNIQSIHFCNPPDLLFLVGCWFKLLHGTKLIFDQHDLCPEVFECKFNRRGFFFRAQLIAEWLTYKVSDVVIATNQSYKANATGRGGKRDEDVFIVRSGPDLDRFEPVPPNPDYKEGKRYLVGYLGTMALEEGIDGYLEAIAHLVKARGRDDIQFMLVGGGTAVEESKRQSVAMGLGGCVTFTGRVSDEELIERIGSCDVCVDPGRKTPFYDQSTMNKIMEYMALGRPIVQYDLTEGRRSAEDASWYAEPNNPIALAEQIEALLADASARRRMGQIGRARMRDQLGWQHQAPKLLAAYQRVWGARAPR